MNERNKLIAKVVGTTVFFGVSMYNLIAKSYNAGIDYALKQTINKSEEIILKEGTVLKF